jgi:hypothetical protein
MTRLRAFWCSHADRLRERTPDGRRWLVCARCGDRVPMLTRTDAERAAMQARYPAAFPRA